MSTLIYAVEDEVYLSAPRDVLDEVVACIEFMVGECHYHGDPRMTDQLQLFANKLRAHAQHLPDRVKTEGWLGI